ncbi:uncharacterized protein VTP21DRAFT_1566 [Calcarisporiella thermophila]|uniref:uncharacterized protein n=1 Tax=Calcarisporiella thermophila TaxID=911321 RepID=UPI0037444E89
MASKSPDFEVAVVVVPEEHGKDAGGDQSVESQNGYKRTLHSRHLQMISIGGVIGQGLFLSSGATVAIAGPAGALISYVIVGSFVYFVTMSLGELATYIPVPGAFTSYCSRFVDRSFGAAIGWNYWVSWSTILAIELTAVPIIMSFWTKVVPSWAWSAITLVIIFALNMFGARIYGEAEYIFSLVKVLTCIVFIIVGVLTDGGVIGGEVVGFKYWSDPGAFGANPILGIIDVLVIAGLTMQGSEIVGVTAAESRNPRRDVPLAVKQVFYRILIFYILCIFIIGLLIPANDPRLLDKLGHQRDATVSPFTLVFVKAGISGVASVVNAVILITIFSCGNSCLYVAARTLTALSKEGVAPKWCGWIDKRGVPVAALCCSTLFGFIAFLTSFLPVETVFTFLMNTAGLAGFVTWTGISWAHYRFRRAFERQGRSLDDLPFRGPLFPYGNLYSLGLCVLIIFGQGYSAFLPPVQPLKFFLLYTGPIFFLLLWGVCQLVLRSRIIPLEEIDLDAGKRELAKDQELQAAEEQNELEKHEEPEAGGWKRRWRKLGRLVL